MQSLFLFADLPHELNTSYWRCFIPAQRLKDAGHQTWDAHLSEALAERPNDLVQSYLDQAEVIVVERVFIDHLRKHIDSWHRQGKKVVGTFDDAYHLINPHKDSGQFWRGKKRNQGTGNFKEFRGSLKFFDRIIVPSKVLMQDYEPYCQDIQYVPNFTMPELWKDIKKRPPDNQIVIGWGGSSGHIKSWMESGIIPALSKLSASHSNLRVSIYGGGIEIPDLLKKAKIRCEFHGWTEFTDWPQKVASFDIGLAVLAGEYDRRRSNAKVLEYSMAKVPWVATDSEPYQGIESQAGLLVKNKPHEWSMAIDTLIRNEEIRTRNVESAYGWALAHTEKCVPAYEQALGVW